jgi:hypothetical protein
LLLHPLVLHLLPLLQSLLLHFLLHLLVALHFLLHVLVALHVSTYLHEFSHLSLNQSRS